MRRWLLIGLELFVAGGAFYGGLHLLRWPDGSSIQLSPTVLQGTPFPDFRGPGLILLVVNGVVPLGAALAGVLRRPLAPGLHLAAGVSLCGWMGVQLALIGLLAPWQLIISALGLIQLTLALLELRAARS